MVLCAHVTKEYHPRNVTKGLQLLKQHYSQTHRRLKTDKSNHMQIHTQPTKAMGFKILQRSFDTTIPTLVPASQYERAILIRSCAREYVDESTPKKSSENLRKMNAGNINPYMKLAKTTGTNICPKPTLTIYSIRKDHAANGGTSLRNSAKGDHCYTTELSETSRQEL